MATEPGQQTSIAWLWVWLGVWVQSECWVRLSVDCEYSRIDGGNCGLVRNVLVIAVELKKFPLFAKHTHTHTYTHTCKQIYFYSLRHTHTQLVVCVCIAVAAFSFLYSLSKFSILLSCCDGYLMKCNLIFHTENTAIYRSCSHDELMLQQQMGYGISIGVCGREMGNAFRWAIAAAY